MLQGLGAAISTSAEITAGRLSGMVGDPGGGRPLRKAEAAIA
ncbi:MAG: hypothetical protein WBA31_06730 [Candidatus Dormiibacterota bacterium]